MIILLSEAKIIDIKRGVESLAEITEPIFKGVAEELMLKLAEYDLAGLAQLFSISSDLAAKLKRDIYNFTDSDSVAQAAVVAFWGAAYKKLCVDNFGKTDFEYAQEHLRLASAAYGMLRPLDAIRPYRMDFYTQLTGYEGNLQHFWRERITTALLDDIRSEESGILLNLASNETFTSFDVKLLKRECEVVNVAFKVVTHKGVKSAPVVIVKQARGALTGFIIRNRVESVEALSAFDEMDMTFYPEMSDGNNVTFIYK
ncbi:MAG: YaaA family protein [Bacteroidales bacterium]